MFVSENLLAARLSTDEWSLFAVDRTDMDTQIRRLGKGLRATGLSTDNDRSRPTDAAGGCSVLLCRMETPAMLRKCLGRLEGLETTAVSQCTDIQMQPLMPPLVFGQLAWIVEAPSTAGDGTYTCFFTAVSCLVRSECGVLGERC